MRLPGATLEEKLRLNSRLDGECYRWTGAHTPNGYGHATANGRRRAVHRVAYELWVGPISDGLEIDHLCRVRDCINPAHLEAVTHRENLRRAVRTRGKHCRKGHEFTPENTWMRRRGERVDQVCRTCKRAINSRFKRRKRGMANVLLEIANGGDGHGE